MKFESLVNYAIQFMLLVCLLNITVIVTMIHKQQMEEIEERDFCERHRESPTVCLECLKEAMTKQRSGQ